MLLEEKKKISEDSEFSIFPCTQNRKLRNLEKCSFTSNFDGCCNLRFRNGKNWEKNLKMIKKIKKKKRKLPRFLSFRFCSIPQMKNFEISETFRLLQIFTVVVPFSKFVLSRERVKPCFFVSFNIKSHLSWKLYWSSSSCSVFLLNIDILIDFSGFLTFPCYKEINDVTYNRWCRHFFTFNLL